MKRHPVLSLALSLVLTAAFAGCIDRSGRAAIEGVVEFKDGQPVDRGSIDFSPAGTDTKTTSGAPIIDGHYHIPREKGLRAGKYIVRIYASTATPSVVGPPGKFNLATPKERVSPAFNTQSKLVAEVESTRDQKFNFQVE